MTKKTINTSALTEDQKAAFVRGWENAGGPMDDGDSATPWCAPWEWAPEISVTGDDPEDWGAQWYAECAPEIAAIEAETEEE